MQKTCFVVGVFWIWFCVYMLIRNYYVYKAQKKWLTMATAACRRAAWRGEPDYLRYFDRIPPYSHTLWCIFTCPSNVIDAQDVFDINPSKAETYTRKESC